MPSFLQFGSIPFIYYPMAYFAILLGGWWSLGGILFVVVTQVAVDNLTPVDKRLYHTDAPGYLNLLVYLHIPLGMLLLYLLVWQATPGDMLTTGALLSDLFGTWVMARHTNLDQFGLISCALLCGFIMSSNTIAAHELMHRLSNRMELFFAQILLAMNLDTQSAISHVYSHHANVGTDQDAATARRGETVYGFILRSTIGQYRESIEIESKRLHKLGKPVFSLHNKVISGFLLILLLVLVIYLLSDGYGVWVFFFSGLFSKFMFESVNYIQHYGLIRVPGTRVEPRHSWDCMSRAGTKTFYALARHSHHHARASLPYWELAPADKQQVLYLKYGYLGEMLIALIPPLWFTHTSPQLLEWDANLACPEEAELAREANRKSGLHALAAGAA